MSRAGPVQPNEGTPPLGPSPGPRPLPSLSARGRRRAQEAVFCVVTGRPSSAHSGKAPLAPSHGPRPPPLARAGQIFCVGVLEACIGRGDRGGCGGAGQSRCVRGARLIRSWWWDPREALVGQLGSAVGGIRWVRGGGIRGRRWPLAGMRGNLRRVYEKHA